MKERTLALAGVFQATELVRQAANHGTWSGYAASACLHSLFALEAVDLEEVYGSTARLRLGVETLISVLQGEGQHVDSLRYAIALLQLQRRFKRKRALQRRIGERLAEIAGQHLAGEQHEREDRQAADIAQLYSETISLMTPRIVVGGRPQYLQLDRTVNWIRTLLLAGLRSAVLWDQLGGGRWSLMFGRRELLRESQQLLAG